MSEADTVKACPKCFKMASVCCWHPDTEEIATVWTSVEQVRYMRRLINKNKVDNLELSVETGRLVLDELNANLERDIERSIGWKKAEQAILDAKAAGVI